MNDYYLINLPHCGINIPNEYIEDYYLTEPELHQNIYEYADLYTDELYEVLYKRFGGVKNEHSRLFMDPERFFDDSQEDMSRYGLGWFYETSIIKKRPLRTTLNKDKVAKHYKEYHQELYSKTKEKLEKYDKCTIIDCHSFSNHPYWFQPSDMEFPDICIGFDELHKDTKVIDIIMEEFSTYDIALNNPYAGSLVPMEYYGKKSNVRSVMIEINKKLYLEPDNKKKNDDFDTIKQKVTNIGNNLIDY